MTESPKKTAAVASKITMLQRPAVSFRQTNSDPHKFFKGASGASPLGECRRHGVRHQHLTKKDSRVGNRENLDDGLHRRRKIADRKVDAGQKPDQGANDGACGAKGLLAFEK